MTFTRICALASWGALLVACVDLGNLTGGDDAPPGTSRSCTAPSKPDCGAHGRCDDRGGTARCVCETGFTGAACNECAEGLQDNDKNGTCEPSCAKATLNCGTHARCDDTSGTAACACAPGYVLESNACAWRGGPKDPGFSNDPAGAWKLVGGASILGSESAAVDRGVARFAGAAACSGSVAQTFPMPQAVDAEPFALDLAAIAVGDEPTVVSVIANGAVVGSASVGETATRTKVCLGERAYGGELELTLRPRVDTACAEEGRLDLDRAAIVPDSSCAPAGTFPNGNFETTGNWVPSTVAGNAGSVAEVATNVGTGGGRAGRLTTSNVCQEPHLDAVMSPPQKSMERAALSFTYKGTNKKTMTLSSGRLSETAPTFGEVTANATFQSAKICLPEWAKGVAVPISFTLEDFGGTCADANAREFVFDDVAFVSEPSCPKDAFVIDGGFEGSAVVTAWLLRQPTAFSTIAEIRQGGDAHAGNGHLVLGSGQACQDATARQTITVPRPSGNAGPAVKLWYRLPTATKAAFSTSPGGALTIASTWTQKTICLDAKKAGEPLVFTIEASGGSGTCATTFATERIEIDDVEVTTDATCKTN